MSVMPPYAYPGFRPADPFEVDVTALTAGDRIDDRSQLRTVAGLRDASGTVPSGLIRIDFADDTHVYVSAEGTVDVWVACDHPDDDVVIGRSGSGGGFAEYCYCSICSVEVEGSRAAQIVADSDRGARVR